MKLKIYSDGGARGNPGPSGIGVVVFSEKDEKLMEHKDCVGEGTNNMAEYLALIAAQELAKEMGGREVLFHLDSELVVRQMKGEYKIKDEKLKQLWQVVKEGETQFQSVGYQHLPRSNPFMVQADRLVNLALDGE